jgi:2-dehydropantoate 2-reductase
MKVVVVGVGALGTIVAAHLSRAGHDVTALARGRRAALIEQDGLTVRGLADLNVACAVLDDPAEIPDAELLIITVKTYDNEQALATIPQRKFGCVFSVANGVLKNAQLAERFGKDVVLGCMANTSGELLDNGEVRFTRNVCLHLGELAGGLSTRATAIAQAIDASGITTKPEQDISVIEWSKFVGWTALFALSVTTRFTTGSLLSEPNCAWLAAGMINEMAEIAKGNGIRITDQSPVPVASVAAAPRERGQEILMELGNEWLRTAPNHRMSSLQDLERGKPLEVEGTLGFAVTESHRLGISGPNLATFYTLVAGINSALRRA